MNINVNEMNARHYFGELNTENGFPVFYETKYHTARIAACRMIEESSCGLLDEDFYIQKKKTPIGGVVYSGLVISHAGCQKLAQALPENNRVKPECFRRSENVFGGSLIYEYVDETTYQVGEVSSLNCNHPWPYAMAFKRCYDRVVLEKTALSAAGVHSVEESEEFSRDMNVVVTEKPAMAAPDDNKSKATDESATTKTSVETSKEERKDAEAPSRKPVTKVVAPDPVEKTLVVKTESTQTESAANAADQVALPERSAEITMTLDEALGYTFTKARLAGKTGKEVLEMNNKAILTVVARATTGKEQAAAKALLSAM